VLALPLAPACCTPVAEAVTAQRTEVMTQPHTPPGRWGCWLTLRVAVGVQAALGDNPQLLQMLLQQLYNRPTTPAAAGAGVAAAAGGGGGGGGRGAAAVGVRGSAASEGSPEAGRHDLGPVPVSGLRVSGLSARECTPCGCVFVCVRVDVGMKVCVCCLTEASQMQV
jgi:hypothetical protein